jgi:hypothetical protein
MKLTITVDHEILVEGNRCHSDCDYHDFDYPECRLFDQHLDLELGQAHECLRCARCLEAPKIMQYPIVLTVPEPGHYMIDGQLCKMQAGDTVTILGPTNDEHPYRHVMTRCK